MRASEIRTMSRTPRCSSFLRDRQHAPFRHSRTAQRARMLQHQHRVLVHVQVVAIDARFQVAGNSSEHHRRPGVLPEAPVGRDGLDHGAIRREASVENRRSAGLRQRRFASANHLVG